MPLDRTAYNTLVDDDGSGTTGTIWSKARVDDILDAVDAYLLLLPTLAGANVFAGANSFTSTLSQTFSGTGAVGAVLGNTHASGYGVKIIGASDATRYALTVNKHNDLVTFLQVLGDGSVIVGNPTGGGKGAGTVNAQAVYDDNVLLTDRVFEADYPLPSIADMRAFFERERHLPTIPGREAWEQGGRFSLGALATRLWETVEVQARYIAALDARLARLEPV
jgi:hypothetical protein